MKNTTPPDYWWDKVIRMGEAATVCAAGDPKLENIIREHLRVWPYNEHWQITVSLNQDRWRTEVLLGAVVSFLRGRGLPLPDSLPGLPEPVKREADAWLAQRQPWRSDTPPVPQGGGQVEQQTPTPTPQVLVIPPPEKKLFTPDNRVVSTKDTPRAGSMRLLITDLLLGHPDEKSGQAWSRIVKLASSEEGRAGYPFLVGVNATLSEVYYLEGEGKRGIDKEGFVKKFSYIKREMNR